jgi:hypothetical protein
MFVVDVSSADDFEDIDEGIQVLQPMRHSNL